MIKLDEVKMNNLTDAGFIAFVIYLGLSIVDFISNFFGLPPTAPFNVFLMTVFAFIFCFFITSVASEKSFKLYKSLLVVALFYFLPTASWFFSKGVLFTVNGLLALLVSTLIALAGMLIIRFIVKRLWYSIVGKHLD